VCPIVPDALTYSGRTFLPADLALVREVAADCGPLGLTEIARTVCELLDWTRPTGRLTTHECRQWLARLHDGGARRAAHAPRDRPAEAAYGTRPLLLETFVDAQRFAGTCYRAANWQCLGDTQGRGRMDRHHAAHGAAPKRIFVYPLVRDVRHRLCQTSTPTPSCSTQGR
jgi:hypothetical protein